MKTNTYIFDYYGTLVDIRTDEKKDELWEVLAGIYSVYGADYTPAELRKAYLRICEEEEEHVTKILKVWHPEMVLKYPEIELTRVFARLLFEAENTHDTAALISGREVRSLPVEELSQSEWAHFISNTFRVLSREKLCCYKHTLSTLEKIKKSGCKIYLLSNAQGSFTRTELELTGVLHYLDGVFISSEKNIKKPQPEFMEQLIKMYDIDRKNAVMVGNDMYSDMGIARACGIKGIYLNTFKLTDKQIEAQMKDIGASVKEITVIRNGDIKDIL